VILNPSILDLITHLRLSLYNYKLKYNDIILYVMISTIAFYPAYGNEKLNLTTKRREHINDKTNEKAF